MKKDFGQLAWLLFPLVLLTVISSQPVFAANKITQKITFAPIASLKVAQTKLLKATSTSKLKVTFKTLTPKICTVKLATVKTLSVGTCKIAANQLGNKKYSAAKQIIKAITVSKANITGKSNQSIIFGVAPTVIIGGTGKLSATSTSSLAVTFRSNTLGICTVSGATVTGIAAGTCIVTANQAGNTAYNPANQVIQNIVVSIKALAKLVLQVPGVGTTNTTYSKMTIMSSTGLAIANHQPIPEGNQPHQTMMAWLSNLFVKNAQASIVPNGCLTRLVGYNQTKEAWEVLKLTTDGSEACAMSFVSAGDYYISQMNAFQLDGGYCNLLMMRKTDGKLFCGLEENSTTYNFSYKNNTIADAKLSSNGKYGLLSVFIYPDYIKTMEGSIELLRLDLKTATGIPAIKVIWRVPNPYPPQSPSGIIDSAPTNAGNAFVFYTYDGLTFHKFIQVNNALNDINSNNYVKLPTLEPYIFSINTSVGDQPLLLSDNNVDNLDTVIMVTGFMGSTNSVIRINSNNSSSITYDYLGFSNLWCGYNAYFCSTMLIDSKFYWLNFLNNSYSSLILYSNSFLEHQDISSVNLVAARVDPVVAGCTVGNGTCTTDDPILTVANNLVYSTSTFKVSWFGKVGWLILTQGSSSTPSLYKIDLLSNTSIRVILPDVKIKTIEASGKYPGDVIVTGTDYRVGVTGSPFAARITNDGGLVDYSVLPTSFTTSTIQVVEL